MIAPNIDVVVGNIWFCEVLGRLRLPTIAFFLVVVLLDFKKLLLEHPAGFVKVA